MAPRARLSDRSFLVVPLLSLALAGCGATCKRNPDKPPTIYSEGTTDHEAEFYETAPWEGPWLDFGKGETFRLMHHLGGVPQQIDPWLAFDPKPADWAPGAGNQVTVEDVTSEYIDIRNDTCSDVYLRVTAAFPTHPEPDGG